MPAKRASWCRSPKVATYDLQPEMSCPEVTAEARRGDPLRRDRRRRSATSPIPTWSATPASSPRRSRRPKRWTSRSARSRQAVRDAGGALLVTADHGNVEMMRDPDTGQPHTAHTVGPVPFVYVGPRAATLRSGGALRDVAPTILDLLGLPQAGRDERAEPARASRMSRTRALPSPWRSPLHCALAAAQQSPAQGSRDAERKLENVKRELKQVAAERRKIEGQRGDASRAAARGRRESRPLQPPPARNRNAHSPASSRRWPQLQQQRDGDAGHAGERSARNWRACCAPPTRRARTHR